MSDSSKPTQLTMGVPVCHVEGDWLLLQSAILFPRSIRALVADLFVVLVATPDIDAADDAAAAFLATPDAQGLTIEKSPGEKLGNRGVILGGLPRAHCESIQAEVFPFLVSPRWLTWGLLRSQVLPGVQLLRRG